MKTMTIYTINEAGLAEIHAFLAKNHKLGGDRFRYAELHAWANDAEFSLADGNGADIELSQFDSIHGHTQTYTISAAGIDAEEIEIDD